MKAAETEFRGETCADELAEKRFITLIQLWHKIEKPINNKTSFSFVCVCVFVCV